MDARNSESAMWIVDRAAIDSMLGILETRGYLLLGPVVRDGAVVYDEIHTTADMPIGWTDRQAPGAYRLEQQGDGSLFEYVVGPHSWKKHLFPPAQKLYSVTRHDGEFQTEAPPLDTQKLALVGVRACELAAIAVQDKVFLHGAYVDSNYKSRRERTFVLAVDCGKPADTCFCASMETGPEARAGFDLALTEMPATEGMQYAVRVGSKLGKEVLESVGRRDATEDERGRRVSLLERAIGRMNRSMQTADLKGLLYRNMNHARWDDVAERCMSCANCTMVCPTCFCSTVEDVTDLSGDHAERWRKWDSCFTMDFSYIVGGHTRPSTRARYRQWMTHKLATWQDQFDMIGCVGCGRCITWCPVGIDITQEVAAIRESERKPAQVAGPKEH